MVLTSFSVSSIDLFSLFSPLTFVRSGSSVPIEIGEMDGRNAGSAVIGFVNGKFSFCILVKISSRVVRQKTVRFSFIQMTEKKKNSFGLIPPLNRLENGNGKSMERRTKTTKDQTRQQNDK